MKWVGNSYLLDEESHIVMARIDFSPRIFPAKRAIFIRESPDLTFVLRKVNALRHIDLSTKSLDEIKLLVETYFRLRGYT